MQVSNSPGLISGGHIPNTCPTLVLTFTSPEAGLSSSFVKTHTALVKTKESLKLLPALDDL
jgi:hypothetical protein